MKTITLEKKMTIENVIDRELVQEMMDNAISARDFWIKAKNEYLHKIEKAKKGK